MSSSGPLEDGLWIMLTSASIAQAAVEGRLPGGPGLRLVELGADFDPMMELVTGTGIAHLRGLWVGDETARPRSRLRRPQVRRPRPTARPGCRARR